MLPATRSSVPALVAGFTAPVSRQAYITWGFGLMVAKYLMEAGLVWAVAGHFYSPLVFLAPLMSLRAQALEGSGDWLLMLFALWNLPFAWVGVSMSVRRARDAGLPGFFGLLFFVPLLNFLVMWGLCAAPSKPASPPTPGPLQGSDRVLWAGLTGVAAGSAIGLGMVGLSVFALGDYGGALFVGAPMVMGTVAGFLLNMRQQQSVAANLAVGVVTVVVSGGLMALTALEGVICLAMAAPICLVLSLLGVAFGRALAAFEHRRAIVAMGLGLPVLALIEPPPGQDLVRRVETTVDIAAPPEVVWDAVIGFGGVELPPPPEWFFQLGIAYPIRAHLDGEGPGAVRYCEFSTGPFIEPITVWDPPLHLAFDVDSSPPTMHEWSIYEKVHAPHLDGILQSKRGEFVLTPLTDGGTRLTGHTWYTFAMAPNWYWGLWSDASIHAIHTRVLEHIRGVAENR